LQLQVMIEINVFVDFIVIQYVTAEPVVQVLTIYEDANGNVVVPTATGTAITTGAVTSTTSWVPSPNPYQPSSPVSPGVPSKPSSIPAGGSGGSSSGYSGDLGGISYSPYHADQSCKSVSEIKQDITAMSNAGYSTFRLYGVDCSQVSSCLSVIQGTSNKIFAGIYDVDQVASEVQQLITQVNGQWSYISTVSILNEAVNDGKCSASQAVSLTQQSKSTLSSAGYTGPVINVDTFNAVIAHPELCSAGDFVGANCHAYFAGVSAEDAGNYVKTQLAGVQSACGGKQVLITGML
jgi:exo-beta-1,3-glucanase (GH17 family)